MRLCNHIPTGPSHLESWFYCSPLLNGNTLRHVFQIAVYHLLELPFRFSSPSNKSTYPPTLWYRNAGTVASYYTINRDYPISHL
ncbi:hypothetical protein CMEL01_14337 [Colletotrichum melonis]|uniref:Uncharacterized protein n=1 Tax=Colletotrichum melonis TaxID=1209925 RepID=A0AAI9XWU7_9PEZI|nr:hypothetical protein CMEL01_14337 [Colletotrichum melonis]